ncbi:MAG: BON domain-containing protein [Bryobacteraceae bacterium]
MKQVALLFLIGGGLLAAQQPRSSQPIDMQNQGRPNQPSEMKKPPTDTGQKIPEDRRRTAATKHSHAADLKTTADVRKALREDESLSLAARNVRVTTANGEVTLRGRVNSESEKTAVARKVQDVVGTGNVANDLTVPAHKSSHKSESGG